MQMLEKQLKLEEEEEERERQNLKSREQLALTAGRDVAFQHHVGGGAGDDGKKGKNCTSAGNNFSVPIGEADDVRENVLGDDKGVRRDEGD